MIDFLLHILSGNRFHQITGYPELDRRHRILLISGTEHNLAVRVKLHHFLGKDKTAHSTHINIQKCHIYWIVPHPFQCFFTGTKCRNRCYIGRCLYRLGKCVQHQRLVIYCDCNHPFTPFGIEISTFVPTPGVLSTVSVPPHMASTRPRMFRRPICFLSSSKIDVAKPAPLSSTLTQ